MTVSTSTMTSPAATETFHTGWPEDEQLHDAGAAETEARMPTMQHNFPRQRSSTQDLYSFDLAPERVDDLVWLTERTGWSASDVVNRAIALYRTLKEDADDGAQLLIKSPDGHVDMITRY